MVERVGRGEAVPQHRRGFDTTCARRTCAVVVRAFEAVRVAGARAATQRHARAVARCPLACNPGRVPLGDVLAHRLEPSDVVLDAVQRGEARQRPRGRAARRPLEASHVGLEQVIQHRDGAARDPRLTARAHTARAKVRTRDVGVARAEREHTGCWRGCSSSACCAPEFDRSRTCPACARLRARAAQEARGSRPGRALCQRQSRSPCPEAAA